MRLKSYIQLFVFFLYLPWTTFAEESAQDAASEGPESVSLFFRETFKGREPGAPEQIPLTPQHAANPDLELKLYGPGANTAPDHESGLFLNNQEDAGRPGEIVQLRLVGRHRRPLGRHAER